MKRRHPRLAPLVLLFAALAACADDAGSTRTDTVAPPDTTPDADAVDVGDVVQFDTSEPDAADTASPGEVIAGGFGAPCQSNLDCLDGYCVEGAEGFFCTRNCDEECPSGFDCRSVQTGSADPAFLCLPRLKKLCIPCKADYQCTGGACLQIDGSGQCAYGCEAESDCPTGYGCEADPAGEREGKFCQPKSGSCSCTADSPGALRTCINMNLDGLCYGVETCDPTRGWVDCTAPTPAAEICDGRDNDCNALVDDGLVNTRPCTNTVDGVGTCEGVEVCVGTQGYVCTAATPEVEACDFRDNDCDGKVDEGFTDAEGEFTLTAHCGTCNNDCSEKIPNGTGRCEQDGESQPLCVVDQCDPDYVAINRFQCTLPPDVSCQPCREDNDCYGGSCVVLDGQEVCVSPCGASADACPDGYSCQDLGGGAGEKRCVPDTLSCLCTGDTQGQVRSCSNANAAGTCFGVETCGASGWGVCNAATAIAEVCNGKDDDCDGVADDGVDNGSPCTNTIAGVGSCQGVRICMGAQGYSCTAPTPELESCDFRDNDCDGLTDEAFKNAAGVFDQTAHCGTCNNDCTDKIANGTGRCEAVAGASPVCVVAGCDEDYIAVNRFQCSLPPDVSCQPCTADGDCFGGSCVSLDGQKVCVTPCGEAGDSCQPGYACEAVAGGAKRCMPVTDSCVCSALTDGQNRTCKVSNASGTCFGQEVCDDQRGWTGCDARVPAAELCDGLDNDCNGRADDGVMPPAQACQKSVTGVGTCTGTWFCQDPDAGGPAGVGWTCSAPTPRAEVCDFLDDDCDGVADDDFKNAQGLYVSDLHCGSCGISCGDAIPNATATCAVADGRARCEVLQCAPGYYRAGPTTCAPVSEDLCAPCATDANCPTPGDKCLDLDGGKFCGRDCAAGNLHGAPAGQCPTGYACEAFGAARQCVPASGSCTCLAGDDGDSRTCLASNALGTCYGQELCDADLGWSACSARTPATETCNGVDDDCNSAIDDVAGRGQSCTVSNGFGTCSGVRDCAGGSLVCEAKTPAAEKCNYDDDDCDGQTDEGYVGLFGSCSKGQGVCQRYGFVACKADGSGTECNAVEGPKQDEICDGLDNDCDGQTDEGAAFTDKGKPCFDGLGVCQVAGVYVCNATGSALECSAKKLPAGPSELCDGLDNDCDGATDEAFPDKNKVCEDGLGVCKRFGTQVCAANGSGLVCSAVKGPSATETCDLLDNDCDGATDNGYLTNGKYASDTACGNCFTNCQTIFAKPNAFGQCNSVPAVPTCRMVCNGGFYDLNGVPDDGCEFQLEATAVYVSESDAAAKDDASCGGGPAATGGGRYPCKSITQGLTRANATGSGKTKVLVAGGAYNESLSLRAGISVYGGYSPRNWVRDPDTNLTAIFGTQTSGHRKTVIADGITSADTVFDGFSVYGQVANGVGENSYAIWVRNSNNRLTLSNNVIWPGTGGPGGNGTRGNDGGNGGGGGNGLKAKETSPGAACYKNCTGSNAGGAGGTNGSCAGTAGGAGGTAPCPDWNESVDLCTSDTSSVSQSSNPAGAVGSGTGGGTAGIGGCDQLIDPGITDCACNVPAVSTSCPLSAYSSEGGNGQNGAPGSAGTRNASTTGQTNNGEWQGFGGAGGVAGAHGAGGGGGGAGGGVESYYQTNFGCGGSLYSDFGGSGGGGGAGGCGGTGGTGGSAGGGSFGIFVTFATNPGTAVPNITGNELHLGFGGSGGRGGDGGTAGNGGAGGLGGPGAPEGTAWCAIPGSKGGEGGDGGPGGGGAGGNGGVAYGLYAAGGSAAVWGSGNTYFSDGAGGAGGAGGGTGAGGLAGQSGLTGTAATRNF